MKYSEIMRTSPITCVPDDGVSMAIGLMWDNDCGGIPVVKDSESNELVGMITDRDIAMCVIKHINSHHSQIKVSDCMASNVISCKPEDMVETAIELMKKHRIRRIPVVDDNGSCLGVISQADLILNLDGIEPVIDLLQHISTPYTEEPSTEVDSPEAEEKQPVPDPPKEDEKATGSDSKTQKQKMIA